MKIKKINLNQDWKKHVDPGYDEYDVLEIKLQLIEEKLNEIITNMEEDHC